MLDELRANPEVLYGAALALLIVVLLTPVVGNFARILGVVDRPGGRRAHERIVPKLGGLALFFGILIPALAFVHFSPEMRGTVVSSSGVETSTFSVARSFVASYVRRRVSSLTRRRKSAVDVCSSRSRPSLCSASGWETSTTVM